MSEYCPSKAAIRSFAESMDAEFMATKRSVNVTTICPVFARTGITASIPKTPGENIIWITVNQITDTILKGLHHTEFEHFGVGWFAHFIYWFSNIFGARALAKLFMAKKSKK